MNEGRGRAAGVLRYLPYLALAAGALLALAVPEAEEPGRKAVLIGWAAICIGLVAGLSAMKAVARGEVLVHHRRAARAERPAVFWFAVVASRALPAVLLLGFGALRLL